jgi:hypothetical protein
MTQSRFRVNSPTVTHETIDGEAVIINLDSGNYYSLIDAGCVIWNLVGKHLPASEIISRLSESYEGQRATIESGVVQLLSQLEQESLIVPDYESSELPEPQNTGPQNGSMRPQFQTPVLQKYTDMQELLLLDPIHDVDDMGWPRVNPEPEE